MIGLLAFSGMIWAQSTQPEDSDKQIHVTMSELGKTILLLNQDIYDGNTKSDKKHNEALKENVRKLNNLFAQAKAHFDEQSITYGISYEVMSQYLDEINQVIKNKDFNLARGMLKSLPQLCVGCHTQDPQFKKIFPGSDRKHFKSDYDYAEFLYTTRDYNQSIHYFESYLTDLNPADDEKIKTAFKRILLIYAQIEKKPAEGAQVLKKYMTNSEIPKDIREDVNEWIKGLDELATKSVVEQKSYQKRQEYINKYLEQLKTHGADYLVSEKDKVFYMTLRGLLYEYLNQHPPEQDVPVVLYWLAVCDRTLDYNFFDNLAELYLKECILSYPTHSYARRCLNEYENYMRFTFTGSSGTYLPQDVAEEIEILKGFVNHPPQENQQGKITKPIIK